MTPPPTSPPESPDAAGPSKIDAWRKPPARSERNAMSTEVAEPSTVIAPADPVTAPHATGQAAPGEFTDGPLRPKLAQLTKVSIVIPVYNEERSEEHTSELQSRQYLV